MNRGDRPIPHWLRPQWEKKKRETALRIADAVEKLTSERRPVTFSSIREAVKILYGLSLSTNTIRRNELAYEIYRQHSRQPRARNGRTPSLLSLYKETDVDDRAALYAKVARLRREPKDSLITRLIRLENQFSRQAHVENKLREEVIQISLKLSDFERTAKHSARD